MFFFFPSCLPTRIQENNASFPHIKMAKPERTWPVPACQVDSGATDGAPAPVDNEHKSSISFSLCLIRTKITLISHCGAAGWTDEVSVKQR